MITEETLIKLGFEEPLEYDTTWTFEFCGHSCEGVHVGDLIFCEVDIEDQTTNLHYLDNGHWDLDDCIMIFLPMINTDKKLTEFINLITGENGN